MSSIDYTCYYPLILTVKRCLVLRNVLPFTVDSLRVLNNDIRNLLMSASSVAGHDIVRTKEALAIALEK